MQTLSGLLEITERKEKGPATTFEKSHLLLVFVTIGDLGTIGRAALAVRSGLGEGAVRTVLGKLRDDGYADANASGWFLTPGGKRVYDSIWNKFSPIVTIHDPVPRLGDSEVALAVRGAGKSVRYGIEQRDSAVRVGATGVTTYVIEANRFTIPGGSDDCEREFPGKIWSELRKEVSPKNGDAMILCGGKDETSAKVGALAAALSPL